MYTKINQETIVFPLVLLICRSCIAIWSFFIFNSKTLDTKAAQDVRSLIFQVNFMYCRGQVWLSIDPAPEEQKI